MNSKARHDRSAFLPSTHSTQSAWASTATAPSPSPAASPDLRFGEFRVALHLDLLFRGMEVVPLEPRAVQVLRTLALHRGQVVSKEELLDRVWPEAFVTEGVLKKAISQVRRALGADALGRDWIETFHRRGYRLRGADPERTVSSQILAGRRPVYTSWTRTSA